jgi:hypothetical protein
MRALLPIAALALVLPAAAAAKELSAATVCGAKGCTTFQRPSMELAGGGDGFTERAAAPGPYYTVKLAVDADGHREAWTIFYVPGAEMVVYRDETGRTAFERLSGDPRLAFHRYTRGIAPFPAPTITGAAVGGKQVSDPQSYLALFTARGAGEAYPGAADFVPITLHGARPSPWTDGRYLMFSPSTGSLERGTRVVQLAPATVEAIVAGKGLGDGSPAGDSGFAWRLVTGTLAAVVAPALGTLVLIRRGRHPAAA